MPVHRLDVRTLHWINFHSLLGENSRDNQRFILSGPYIHVANFNSNQSNITCSIKTEKCKPPDGIRGKVFRIHPLRTSSLIWTLVMVPFCLEGSRCNLVTKCMMMNPTDPLTFHHPVYRAVQSSPSWFWLSHYRWFSPVFCHIFIFFSFSPIWFDVHNIFSLSQRSCDMSFLYQQLLPVLWCWNTFFNLVHLVLIHVVYVPSWLTVTDKVCIQ